MDSSNKITGPPYYWKNGILCSLTPLDPTKGAGTSGIFVTNQ